MRNFQDTFDTRKRSFIRVFSICMAVPLKQFCVVYSMHVLFVIEKQVKTLRKPLLP